MSAVNLRSPLLLRNFMSVALPWFMSELCGVGGSARRVTSGSEIAAVT